MRKDYFAHIFPPMTPRFRSGDCPLAVKPSPPQKAKHTFKGKEEPEEGKEPRTFKIYKICVRGKSMSVIDYSGRSHDEMMITFRRKFGANLESAV